MPVSLASRSPPRPGPCCWGTGSSRLTVGMLMGVGGIQALRSGVGGRLESESGEGGDAEHV